MNFWQIAQYVGHSRFYGAVLSWIPGCLRRLAYFAINRSLDLLSFLDRGEGTPRSMPRNRRIQVLKYLLQIAESIPTLSSERAETE